MESWREGEWSNMLYLEADACEGEHGSPLKAGPCARSDSFPHPFPLSLPPFFGLSIVFSFLAFFL